MAATGHWSRLERVRGALEPEKLFQTIPGIGGELAGRLSGQLHVETLEALEVAAHDGRLERLEGFGPRRAQMVRIALAERLGRPQFRRMRQSQSLPPVSVLLDIDREYREEAAAGSLRKIAPKRFNPSGEAWLPILHAKREAWPGWSFIITPVPRLKANAPWSPKRMAPSRVRVVRGREAECRTLLGLQVRDEPQAAALG